MKVAEWKRRTQEAAKDEAVELELPSGMKILARRPGPLQLAVWQRLPTFLAAASAQASDPVSGDKAPVERVQELAGFMADMLVWCCVEPRISLTPQNDEELHPRDISERDWVFIVNWAMRVKEAQDLIPFRGGGSDAGNRGDGANVPGPSIVAAGH